MNDTGTVNRFMLLSAARTGSNLLLSLLSAHPSIKTYGELFNLDMLPRESLLQALDDPIAYLRQRVHKARRPEIAAVVFKMFYDHLSADYFRKLVDTSDASEPTKHRFRELSAFIEVNYDWPTLEDRFRAARQFLSNDLSLGVIHLKRHNLLDSLVSLKTAYATTQWWALKDNGGTMTQVHLRPEECRHYFQKLEAFTTEADNAFRGHRRLDVAYEDLVERRDDVLRRIFAFLNVPYQQVSTRMKKQRVAPASASVINYSQLKEHFAETKWGAFFE